MHVLLIEDHAELREMLQAHLQQAGFTADAVACGQDALGSASAVQYDAIILDLGLPDLDGLDVLRALRGGGAATVPILVLTARGAIGERVDGLDAGADDYMLKPFDLLELDARLRSITRRGQRSADAVTSFGRLRFDPAASEAIVGEQALSLTRRELALLAELLRSPGHTVVRDILEDRLYGSDEAVTSNALEAVVSRLRRQLTRAGSDVGIETLRGIGYRLVRHPATAP